MITPLSSSVRFALVVSALFALLAMIAGGATYVMQTRAMANQLAEDVKGLTAGLAQIAGQGDRQDLIEQTAALSGSVGDGSLIAVFVETATGQSFGNARLHVSVDGARELVVGRDVTLRDAASDPPGSYFAYAQRTPLGTVLVGKDDGPLIENQRILLTTMSWGLGLALLASIGLALVIARLNEVRIARISKVLDAVGAGAYDQRIGPMGHDDLGHLAGVVDRTLDRLASGIDAIRQVSTDVAHDLRAPLARLRIRLEPLALSGDIPAGAKHEVGTALAEIDSISSTFDAILRLARFESGSVQVVREAVDLVPLLEQVRELFETTAERGCVITLDVPATSVICLCDRSLVVQAVVNLVHNSVHHCPAPVHIKLALASRGDDSVISVSDDGPGIPAADRERVLKRFVRLDASRRTPGTGLGLSLVAAIVALHGGRLELHDNAPGLRVDMHLLAATAVSR